MPEEADAVFRIEPVIDTSSLEQFVAQATEAINQIAAEAEAASRRSLSTGGAGSAQPALPPVVAPVAAGGTGAGVSADLSALSAQVSGVLAAASSSLDPAALQRALTQVGQRFDQAVAQIETLQLPGFRPPDFTALQSAGENLVRSLQQQVTAVTATVPQAAQPALGAVAGAAVGAGTAEQAVERLRRTQQALAAGAPGGGTPPPVVVSTGPLEGGDDEELPPGERTLRRLRALQREGIPGFRQAAVDEDLVTGQGELRAATARFGRRSRAAEFLATTPEDIRQAADVQNEARLQSDLIDAEARDRSTAAQRAARARGTGFRIVDTSRLRAQGFSGLSEAELADYAETLRQQAAVNVVRQLFQRGFGPGGANEGAERIPFLNEQGTLDLGPEAVSARLAALNQLRREERAAAAAEAGGESGGGGRGFFSGFRQGASGFGRFGAFGFGRGGGSDDSGGIFGGITHGLGVQLGFGVSLGAGFAIFNQLRQGLSEAVNLQQPLQTLQVTLQQIGQGSTFNGLRQSIEQTARSTGVAVTDVTALAQEFVGLYQNAGLAAQATNDAAKILLVTGENAATAGPQIAAIAEDLHASVQTIGNLVVAQGNVTGRTPATILQAAAGIAPVAQEQGLTVQQTLGLVGAAAVGSARSGQEIGQGLARILPELQKNIPTLIAGGFNFSPQSLQGNAGAALTDILSQLNPNNLGQREFVVSQLGGPRYAQILAAALADPTRALQALNEQQSSNNLLNERASAVQETLRGSINRTAQSFTSLAEAFVQGAPGKFFQDLLSGVTSVLAPITSLVEFIGKLNDYLGGFPVRLAEVVVGLNLLAKAVDGIVASEAVKGILGAATAGGGAGVGSQVVGGATTGLESIGGLVGGGLGAGAIINRIRGTGAAVAGAEAVAPAAEVAPAVEAGGGAGLGGLIAANPVAAGAAAVIGALALTLRDLAQHSVRSQERATATRLDNANNAQLAQALGDRNQAVGGVVGELQRGLHDIDRGLFGSFSKVSTLAQEELVGRLLTGTGTQLGSTATGPSLLQLAQQSLTQRVSLGQRGQSGFFQGTLGGLTQANAQFIGPTNSIQDAVNALIQSGQLSSDDLKAFQKDLNDPNSVKAFKDLETRFHNIATGGNTALTDALQAFRTGGQVAQSVQGIHAQGGLVFQSIAQAQQLFQAGRLTSSQYLGLLQSEATIFSQPGVTDPTLIAQGLTDRLTIIQAQQQQFAKGLQLIGQVNQAIGGVFGATRQIAEITGEVLSAQGYQQTPTDIVQNYTQLSQLQQQNYQASISSAAQLGSVAGVAAVRTPSTDPRVAQQTIAALLEGGIDPSAWPPELQRYYAANQGQFTTILNRLHSGIPLQAAILGTSLPPGASGPVLPGIQFNAASTVLLTNPYTSQIGSIQAQQAQISAAGALAQAQGQLAFNPVQVAQAQLAAAQAAQPLAGRLAALQYKQGAGSNATYLGALQAQTVADQQAQAATVSAQANLHQAEQQQAAAQEAYAQQIYKYDPVAAAKAQIKGVQDQASAIGQNIQQVLAAAANGTATAQQYQLAQQYVAANQALVEAQNAIANAQVQFLQSQATAARDPVRAARLQVTLLQQQLAQAQREGAGPATILALQGQLTVAAADVLTTQLQLSESHIQSQLAMKRISAGQAIAQLQALKRIAVGQQEIDQLNQQIYQIQHAAGTDMQFNLPQNINLPTLYQAMRVNASPGGSIGYQDNRNVQVNINVANQSDVPAVQAAVAKAAGMSDLVYGATPRRY